MEKLLEKNTLSVPHDIIENILSRVEFKALLRFKAVAKAWKATISDTVFARNHLQRFNNSTRQNVILGDYYKLTGSSEFKLVELKNHEFEVKSALKYQLTNIGFLDLMCCCDGLVFFQCVPRYGRDFYVLWNPSSGTDMKFWSPDLLYTCTPKICGICYDPLIRDYKVVISDIRRYAVFYCRKSCWIEMEEFSLQRAITGVRLDDVIPDPGIYCDGAIYWAIRTSRSYCDALESFISVFNLDPRKYELVCFDSRDNKFKQVHKPKGVQGNCGLYLASLGGNLSLSCDNLDSRLQIFMMKKYGDQNMWEEFTTIYLELPPRDFGNKVEAVFLTNENEVILYIGCSACYAVYNISKKTFTRCRENSLRLHHLQFPYVESLVFSSGIGQQT